MTAFKIKILLSSLMLVFGASAVAQEKTFGAEDFFYYGIHFRVTTKLEDRYGILRSRLSDAGKACLIRQKSAIKSVLDDRLVREAYLARAGSELVAPVSFTQFSAERSNVSPSRVEHYVSGKNRKDQQIVIAIHMRGDQCLPLSKDSLREQMTGVPITGRAANLLPGVPKPKLDLQPVPLIGSLPDGDAAGIAEIKD